MIGAKLRQLVYGLAHPPVTVGYPLEPRVPDPSFRGRLTVDTGRCVGCGGCADVCPCRCVTLTDVSPTRRVIRRHLDRCVMCGRCVDACAYGALALVPDWELATRDRGDLFVEQDLFMGVCDRCGRCYVPPHPLDRLRALGMRIDEPKLLDGDGARIAGGGT